MTGIIMFLKSPLGMGLSLALALLVYVQFQRNDAAGGAAAENRSAYACSDRKHRAVVKAYNDARTVGNPH